MGIAEHKVIREFKSVAKERKAEPLSPEKMAKARERYEQKMQMVADYKKDLEIHAEKLKDISTIIRENDVNDNTPFKELFSVLEHGSLPDPSKEEKIGDKDWFENEFHNKNQLYMDYRNSVLRQFGVHSQNEKNIKDIIKPEHIEGIIDNLGKNMMSDGILTSALKNLLNSEVGKDKFTNRHRMQIDKMMKNENVPVRLKPFLLDLYEKLNKEL